MKTFTKLFVSAAFLAVSALSVVPRAASAATAPTCDAQAIGTRNTANGPDSIFKIQGSTVSASYKLSGPKHCKLTMQLISWEAPNPTDGKPYSQQKEIARIVKTAGPGTYTLSAPLPNCYYQIDLVFKGTQQYSVRNIGYLHGGDHKCGVLPVTHTTAQITPKPQPTPQTPASTPTAAVTELPHTGPEAVIGTFLSTSGAGTLLHRYVSRKSRRA